MTATITPDASAPTAGAPGAPSRRRKRTFGRYRMAPFLFTVITAALYGRFYSRGNGDFTHRVLAALREQFGGHAIQKHAE